jgi:hypothetical protein
MSQTGPAFPLSPIRSPRFDGILVVGCVVLALLFGAVAKANPIDPLVFMVLLYADIYLLGSHHIVAMYTRLCFDKESAKENRFFLTWLPLIVVLGIVAAMWTAGGTEIITTVYLYWQWFHYTRQSYGITRIYARKEPPQAKFDVWVQNLLLYVVPLWGILYISMQHRLNPNMKFLFSDFWGVFDRLSVGTAQSILSAVGVVALAVTVLWVVRLPMRYLEGKLSVLPTLYVISHLLIFMTGYYWLGRIHINLGWLVINIWHNCQYILIVWLYNNNRFRSGVDGRHPFLSKISQVQYLWKYFGICIGITLIVAVGIRIFAGHVAPSYLPNLVVEGGWAVLVYQALNFHHYIVDSFIWKVRKKEVRERLGVVDEEIAKVAH